MGFPGVSSLPAPPGPPGLVLSCWQQLSHLLCPSWVTLCFSQQAGSSWNQPVSPPATGLLDCGPPPI